MINNGNNHVLHHVILYIEDVDLNTLFSMSAPTLSVSSAALGMWI